MESNLFKIEPVMNAAGLQSSLASHVNSVLADKEGGLPIAIGCKNCGTRDSFTNIRDKNNRSVDVCLQQESISHRSISEKSAQSPRKIKGGETALINPDAPMTDRTGGSITRTEAFEAQEIQTGKTSCLRQSKNKIK